MTPQQLEAMLDDLDDGYEMIFRSVDAAALLARSVDPILHAWSVAEAEAGRAYAAWSERRVGDAYAAYRAAADRAGAALDVLIAARRAAL